MKSPQSYLQFTVQDTVQHTSRSAPPDSPTPLRMMLLPEKLISSNPNPSLFVMPSIFGPLHSTSCSSSHHCFICKYPFQSTLSSIFPISKQISTHPFHHFCSYILQCEQFQRQKKSLQSSTTPKSLRYPVPSTVSPLFALSPGHPNKSTF